MNNNFFDFWKNKTVLLTGHTGFKGTWMSLLLRELGASVIGYSLPIEDGCFFSKMNIDFCDCIYDDIANKKSVRDVIDRYRPEIIIHLASHSSLDGCDRFPDWILRTNLMGVVNILEVSRNIDSVKSVVIVTSDKCYQDTNDGNAYKENDRLGGIDPYSVSKVCQELISKSYREFFFENKIDRRVNIATARAGNVIGIGDSNLTRLIPYIIDCFLNQKTAKLRSASAVRAWQYMLDVLWGYLLLAKKLYEDKAFDAYNFGAKNTDLMTVEDVVKVFADEFGGKYEFSEVERSVENETSVLLLDSTRAKEDLGWSALRTMDDITKEIKNYYSDSNLSEYDRCIEIVRQYIKSQLS